MTVNLDLGLASGDSLDVRDFAVTEGISRLFDVRVTAVATTAELDFEAVIAEPARFEIRRVSAVDGETRHWTGVCAEVEQIGVEDAGLCSYAVRIVPKLWLLTQRRNYRVFQDKSELDVALEVLASWGMEPTLNLDASRFAKRRMRVQYAETDFDFVSRLLEDIGVAYFFEQAADDTVLVLSDCPNKTVSRPPLPFVDKPNDRIDIEWTTEVRVGRHVRPGRYTQSDVDYRKALDYPLAASAVKGSAVETTTLERYHHNYGSFLWKGEGGGDTPFADDRGAARTNENEAQKQIEKRLDAQRVEARRARFRTNAHDLRPGKVVMITDHPRAEIASPMLVVASTFRGAPTADWQHVCEARFCDVDYRPALVTAKPKTFGVESATVTGPAGEQIHTDELGRVRVRFHWDREGANDETSSCWVPLNQPWAGAGFGNVSIPRVGQEVWVDFLGGDPDRPVVIGRVYTMTTPPPYQLPKYKMVSGHRSESYGSPTGSSVEARLGGGASPAAPAATPDASASQPGPFGGPQCSSSDFGQMVQGNNGESCDSRDHLRPANGLMHDDTAGSESVYLQAQRDLSVAIKNNHVTNVGANQVCNASGNDTLHVGGFDETSVGCDRKVDVGGDQTHIVHGNVSMQGLKNLVHLTPAGEQAYVAKTAISLLATDKEIKLLVGNKSVIVMRPEGILISAPDVYINPGAAFMSVVNHGGSLGQASDAQQKHDQAPAQIAANNAKIAMLEQDIAWQTPGSTPLAKSNAEMQAEIDDLKAQNARLGAL